MTYVSQAGFVPLPQAAHVQGTPPQQICLDDCCLHGLSSFASSAAGVQQHLDSPCSPPGWTTKSRQMRGRGTNPSTRIRIDPAP
jgi:hypothetical protein